MTQLPFEKANVRKLSHAYVALALAQDVVKRSVGEDSAFAALRYLLTVLSVTAELLEEVLQDVLPEESPTHSRSAQCSELVM